MLQKIDDYSETQEDWLIPGLLGSSLTLLSGEPKIGKSLFAAHMVKALLNEEQFLGSVPNPAQHKIAWVGFDSNWVKELKERIPKNMGNLYIHPPINYRENEKWTELSNSLESEEISLLVVDHLYGLSDGLDLNNHNEVDIAMRPIMEIVNKKSIPVLLIAHAGKGGYGRAAHSIAIESKARHLLRLTGISRKTKSLVIKGNRIGEESFKINLCIDSCELIESTATKTRERTGVNIEYAQKLLHQAPPDALSNKSAAGRWFHQVGISGTDEAGRQLVSRLVRGGLLVLPAGSNLQIVAGNKLK